jgi:hypothetical protein
MTGHLTTTGIRQVIGQRGSILAAVATVALIGSALVVLVLSYREAVAAHDFVARARERDTLVQRAEKYYWRDREAMNEYLLTRSPGILREIEALDRCSGRRPRSSGRKASTRPLELSFGVR